MRIVICAVFLIVGLTACERTTPVPAPSATGTLVATGTAPPYALTTDRPVTAATTTPSATPARVLAPKESCEAWSTLVDPSVPRLTLMPPAPRGGERVRITGSGLVPGDYRAYVGVPQTEAISRNEDVVATVGAEGTVDVSLAMPEQAEDRCLLVALHQSGKLPPFSTSNPWALAGTFFSTGNALKPAACEELPSETWLPLDGLRATLSPPPYRVGQPITVSGAGLETFRTAPSNVQASFHVAFSDRTSRDDPGGSIAAGTGTRAADGTFTYTFTPREDPRFRGLCVVVVVYVVPSDGLGPVALARFTYP